MTTLQSITAFLAKNLGHSYCDDCLSKGLGIKPRQQVQQKTSNLGKLREYARGLGTCRRCNSERIVIQAVALNSQSKPPQGKSGAHPAPEDAPARSAVLAHHSDAEERHYKIIRAKDRELRAFFDKHSLADPGDARLWLSYLNTVKHILGNINNDVSFLATLLIKQYLKQRFSIIDFDAGAKAQGAPGIDIEAKTPDGKVVVGELKTTKPYQPGFGAAQRATIIKDLTRLAASKADYRFMFVIDAEAFKALAHKTLMALAPGIEVINLVTGETFVCEERQ